MKDYVEVIEYRGCSILIDCSEYPMDPRREWDNAGKMYLFHRNYDLGDKKNPYTKKDFDSWDEMAEAIREDHEVICMRMVRMYEHSGITLSHSSSGYPFNCPWDSMWVGFHFVDREGYKMCIGEPENWDSPEVLERCEKILDSELRTYDQYCRGDVYGFITEDEDGEIIDSCSGFFGHDWKENGLLDEAESSIDYEMKQRLQKQQEYVKKAIKSKIPLEHRKLWQNGKYVPAPVE